MPDINKMAPRSGRVMKEDGTVINIADAGLPVKLTGSYLEVDVKNKMPLYYPRRGKAVFEVLEQTDINDPTHGAITLMWMGQDEDGNFEMLGRSGSNNTLIVYSNDGGETWTRLVAGGYFNSIIYAFITPGPNKSVIVADRQPGSVYRICRSTTFDSDSHSNWTVKVTADAGEFVANYGLSVRENVICITTYGSMNAENPPRFLYLSRDGGENFETIEVAKIEEMPDPGDFHIHDVEYDPWANRIWLSNGDRVNTGLSYSDDWGKTWTTIGGQRGVSVAGQPTSITALPDRVIFGSDGRPNGFYVWYRDWAENSKEVKPEDVVHVYTPDNVDIDSHLSVANVTHGSVDGAICEFPYSMVFLLTKSTTPGYPARLIATPNGEQFYEIFRTDMLGDEFTDAVVGRFVSPVHADPERRMYLTVYTPDSGNIIVKLKLPEWVKVD